MNTASWLDSVFDENSFICVFFCTSIYLCDQGMERAPLNKWNIVPASGQTLRILWFLSPTREGCEVICLWLCFFSPSATALALAGPAALTHFPRWHDQHQPSSTCTDELCHCLHCTRDLLEERWFPVSWISDSDGAGYKSYFHGADEFLFCRLPWTFLSSKLHGPAVYFTGIYCLYKYFIGRCQAV